MQSTLVPVLARLGVIRQGFSMGVQLHGEDLCEVTRGRSVPVSLSCLSPLALVEPDLSRLVQLPGSRSRGTTRVSCSASLQQGLAFPVGQPKDIAAF